jgi:hypothetical protein
MFARVREFLNKSPRVGWILALVLLCVSVFFFIRSRSTAAGPYSPDRMKEMVTIRFTDTDDEITMPRGRVDKELRLQGDHLDPSKGILNPKTGKPTGFLFDKKEWDEMIARINKEKQDAKGRSASAIFSPPPAGKK